MKRRIQRNVETFCCAKRDLRASEVFLWVAKPRSAIWRLLVGHDMLTLSELLLANCRGALRSVSTETILPRTRLQIHVAMPKLVIAHGQGEAARRQRSVPKKKKRGEGKEKNKILNTTQCRRHSDVSHATTTERSIISGFSLVNTSLTASNTCPCNAAGAATNP